jgi:hypothetical protein
MTREHGRVLIEDGEVVLNDEDDEDDIEDEEERLPLPISRRATSRRAGRCCIRGDRWSRRYLVSLVVAARSDGAGSSCRPRFRTCSSR